MISPSYIILLKNDKNILHNILANARWIPDGQLCPTVTNRANYIHWIEDLLALSPAPWHHPSSKQVAGIDIGTGANCIYPLLGTALHGWRFVGTGTYCTMVFTQ